MELTVGGRGAGLVLCLLGDGALHRWVAFCCRPFTCAWPVYLASPNPFDR
jgi:hypothetical protein